MEAIRREMEKVADHLMNAEPQLLRNSASRIAQVAVSKLRGDLLRRAMDVSIAVAELANYFDEE